MNKSTLGLANRAVATINIKGSCKKGNGRFFSVSACRKPGQAVHGSHTEYRFRFRAPAAAVPTDAGVPVLWSSGRCGWFQCWNGPARLPASQYPYMPGNRLLQKIAIGKT